MRKQQILTIVAATFVSAGVSTVCFAQERPEMPPPAEGAASVSESHEPNLAYDHPTLPAEALWPGTIVTLILGSFLLAAGVGVVVRLNTPEEVPAAHSHDEPPGASHHHGPGGTVHPGPEHDLPGGHAHDAGHH